MRCSISRSALAAIRAHAARDSPNEACGLLLGEQGVIRLAQPTANVADTPRCRFEIDPGALFVALRAERVGGPELLGYYHSHPVGDATPSLADADAAAPDGRLWLIVAGARATLWRACGQGPVQNRFVAVELLAAE
jgi:proteasome lid subunit RPN8/RPN11